MVKSVTGSTALHYWFHDPQAKNTLDKVEPDPFRDCPTSPAEFHDSDFDGLQLGPRPFRLAVPSADLRISRRLYKYSVCSGHLPESAFRRASENVCIASPEYCLLQSIRVYPRFRFLELCMQVCGKYSFDKEALRGFSTRDYQLATVDSIGAFLVQMKGYPGISAFQKLLCYLVDGSRSPMETREYLFMCLPKRLGGYGLPRPEMNMRIELDDRERHVARRESLECDLCWPDKMVVVEYDGQPDHSNRKDRDRDSVKRNILLARGYSVFTVTGGQICSVYAFDKVVCSIAEQIGHRLYGFASDWENRRAVLRAELFKSMTGYEQERFDGASGNGFSHEGCDDARW